jgi:hypothetical protein
MNASKNFRWLHVFRIKSMDFAIADTPRAQPLSKAMFVRTNFQK